MIPSKTNTLQMTTPEGIVFALNLASPITRFLAYAIDLACISAFTTILGAIIGLLDILSSDIASGAMFVAYFGLQIGYGILFEWLWRGQTIGKRLLKLRVMDAQGLHLHFSQIVIRNLLRFVDSLPLFYLVGGAACLFSRYAQRLGDLAANTIVVRTVDVAAPDLDQILAGKYNSLRNYPHLMARLRQRTTLQEADIALRAVLRRNEFEPGDRLNLFALIAAHFKEFVEFPQEAIDGISDEQYVRNIVDVLFRG
ncbi:RDD domain containing protein [Candidatus Moduliflexus flocculans]|uniref:RDD domain containing protein n=1 Tax=Candidatus Moduliflexus flocculans TaxID=1499966 RepID=A0A0S6VQA7_9BACT|nr:RDD domain containing protein [Candidatus Moduliflexus flocculans]